MSEIETNPDVLRDFCEAGDGIFTVQLPSTVLCDEPTMKLLLEVLEAARSVTMVFAPEYVPEASVKGVCAYFAPEQYSGADVWRTAPSSRIYTATREAVRAAFEAASSQSTATGIAFMTVNDETLVAYSDPDFYRDFNLSPEELGDQKP